MMRVASEEDILKESQVRETEHLDVYTCPIVFKEAKENLAKWREDMPLASSTFVCHEGSEALEVQICDTWAEKRTYILPSRNFIYRTMWWDAYLMQAAPCILTAL